jgi:hypothetical protein
VTKPSNLSGVLITRFQGGQSLLGSAATNGLAERKKIVPPYIASCQGVGTLGGKILGIKELRFTLTLT